MQFYARTHFSRRSTRAANTAWRRSPQGAPQCLTIAAIAAVASFRETARQDEVIRTTLDRIFAEQHGFIRQALDHAVSLDGMPVGDSMRRVEPILPLRGDADDPSDG